MPSLAELLERIEAGSLTQADINALPRDEFLALTADIAQQRSTMQMENQLLFYKPVSEEAKRFHCSTVQQRVILGGNGCLPLTAPILMSNGGWKNLADIVVGDSVIAVDPATRVGVPANVLNTFRSGVREVFRITFSDGGYFDATMDHCVPLLLNPGSKTSKGYPQEPKKRKLADYVHRFNLKRSDKRLSAISPREIRFQAKSTLPINPYVLGLLLGDGNLTNRHIRFSSIDQRVIERLRRIVQPEFRLKQDRGPNLRISCLDGRNHRMIDHLRMLGLWGCDSRSKFIPRKYLSASVPERELLLAGLIDTDGTIDNYCSTSRELARDFAFLVRSLGGKSTVTEHQNQFGAFWLVYWRIKRRLPLSITEKQRPDAQKPLDYARRIIRKVESLGMMPTGDIEVNHPAHCYLACDWVVVSNSSKSETQLVDLLIEMTGIIPYSLEAIYPKDKLRPPIAARLIVESFITTWEGSIKPKLVWNTWTGLSDNIHGHFGWVPKSLLKNGKWEDSWSAEFRTLRLTNGSTLQVFSHDQEVSKMASASVHRIGVDEGPTGFEWRENLMRLREGGNISLSMTPSDDESKSWASAWVYDDLYVKGQPGLGKDPDIDSFTFRTVENPFIDQHALAIATKNMTPLQKATRLEGAFTHLGGLVYPIYANNPRSYCFTCNECCLLMGREVCAQCGGTDVTEYSNVIEPDTRYYKYPTVFLIDPHPRKAVMMIWVAVTPADDAIQIHEMELDKEPEEIAKRVFDFEHEFEIQIAARVMDSKMAGQAASNAGRRHVTVKDAFDQVGLRCRRADNDFAVGKSRLKNLLKPDPRTRRPRYQIFSTCKTTDYQITHYVWDEFLHSDGKDVKQTPRALNDDMPALMRYFANLDTSFMRLTMGTQPTRSTKRQRRTAYG